MDTSDHRTLSIIEWASSRFHETNARGCPYLSPCCSKDGHFCLKHRWEWSLSSSAQFWFSWHFSMNFVRLKNWVQNFSACCYNMQGLFKIVTSLMISSDAMIAFESSTSFFHLTLSSFSLKIPIEQAPWVVMNRFQGSGLSSKGGQKTLCWVDLWRK